MSAIPNTSTTSTTTTATTSPSAAEAHPPTARDAARAPAGLLACVGPGGGAEALVRRAAQLAAGAPWHAVYVETPRLQGLPSDDRQRILETLKLAQHEGAIIAVLAGSDIAAMLADYAHEQALGRVVMGRGGDARWRAPWHDACMDKLARHAPDLELIALAHVEGKPGSGSAPHTASRRRRYLLAAGASLLTALVTLPLLPYFDMANIAMLFLLTVVLVAIRFGREASVVATLVGVVALMLAAPRFSFAARDLQYAITFLVMLAVGLITGSLTAGLRYQARVAQHRESRSRALYEFARALSGTLQTEQVFEITRDFIASTFSAHTTLLLPDAASRLSYPSGAGKPGVPIMSVLDLGLAQWAFDNATAAGRGTDTLPANAFFYLPLVAPMCTRGVLVIWPEHGRSILIPEQRKQLDTFGALAAIALERVHYVEVAQEVEVNMASERLRNSLLSALSHDMRTPLTSLVGLSESLMLSRPALNGAQHELAGALRDEAVRMSTMVSNLLDMARMQGGHVKLNLQWQTLEEVVGSALRACRRQLDTRTIQTRLAPQLPLVRYDAVLIERVLCNLLENAGKYTPVDACITIAAEVVGESLAVTVSDNGPGLPAGREEALFEKFARGERESRIPGVGLGLAICRAIIEAHRGAISAGAAPGGGAAFVFTLALGTPPAPPGIDYNDDPDNMEADRAL
jgi:two-component system sensor histidine kinase KdpD